MIIKHGDFCKAGNLRQDLLAQKREPHSRMVCATRTLIDLVGVKLDEMRSSNSNTAMEKGLQQGTPPSFQLRRCLDVDLFAQVTNLARRLGPCLARGAIGGS